ncbi:MAG: Uncharacterized protein Athens071426_17 [Parcubacteria group bacterium Athens0714_26]|nr:MAG: Uncharacterized protein Athens101426_225 [Parcubacteria group bacterium Athens1014_26]TSD03810.1 MAG: Uncharacterized protein Athens071426_17 [Parcubacteria group bacterium Athens0714_26]
MEDFETASRKYFKVLEDRGKQSKVYKPHQLAGLELAKILDDDNHKSLYIKLAKFYDNTSLLSLAKRIDERKDIDNKGAYFMKMLKSLKND